MHVAHGAIAEKRHGAVCHPSMGFYLGPPHAAMPDADAIDIERLGDDDVIDARRGKPGTFRQIGHSAVSTRPFIDGAGNLERSRQLWDGGDQCFDRDERRRETALHVACAPPIDPALLHDAGERVQSPSRAGLYDIDMAVEMNAWVRRLPDAPGNDIETRVTFVVAGRARRAHILDGETTGAHSFADEF